MMYAEASYAGPDIHGRTFVAHHFQHIASRDEHLRLERKQRACRTHPYAPLTDHAKAVWHAQARAEWERVCAPVLEKAA